MVVEAGCKKENPHIVPDENVQLYSVKKNVYNLVQHTVLVLSVSISLNCTGFFLTFSAQAVVTAYYLMALPFQEWVR